MSDVFQAIQDSNMSKLGADGKPIYREDGKVMKGPHYFKPDIQGVLQRAGALPLQSMEE
jgi:predicted HAD superfamily Cof-like phosphohydrolase